MNYDEKAELKDMLDTWYRACCGRAGRSRNSICTVGRRVACQRVHDALVALIDRRPAADDADTSSRP